MYPAIHSDPTRRSGELSGALVRSFPLRVGKVPLIGQLTTAALSS